MRGGRRLVLSVVGARPNLVKMAPVVREIERHPDEFGHVLVHTGQHYDREMSDLFFEQLGLGSPDHQLAVGPGSHAQQTGRVMERLEPLLAELRPDLVLVAGDVNSTMAAALAAAKLDIPVGHVEAGLRSFDRSMPEEVNRIVADTVSGLHFTHSPEARDNLLAEGAREESIHEVGNTMIDTVVAMRELIEPAGAAARLGLAQGDYLLVTLHRPALVDTELIAFALAELGRIAPQLPVVFPVHPRTRARLSGWAIPIPSGVRLTEPLGYVEFLSLMSEAAAVLTDSGGVQEETTWLGVPCFTLRDRTERPITVEMGTNRLLGLAPERIAEIPAALAGGIAPPATVPPSWDGHAAERLVAVLRSDG